MNTRAVVEKRDQRLVRRSVPGLSLDYKDNGSGKHHFRVGLNNMDFLKHPQLCYT